MPHHSTVSKSGHIRQNKPNFSGPHPETLMQISHAVSPSARHRCLRHLLATDKAMAAAYLDARGPSRPPLSQGRRHIRQNKTLSNNTEFCRNLLVCQKLNLPSQFSTEQVAIVSFLRSSVSGPRPNRSRRHNKAETQQQTLFLLLRPSPVVYLLPTVGGAIWLSGESGWRGSSKLQHSTIIVFSQAVFIFTELPHLQSTPVKLLCVYSVKFGGSHSTLPSDRNRPSSVNSWK